MFCFLQIVGFCGECTQDGKVKLSFDTIDDVDNLADFLERNKIHFARELTVVTIAPFGRSTFRAIPIFAMGSCKSSNERQQTKIFEEVTHVCKGIGSLHGLLLPPPNLFFIAYG